MTTFHKSRVLTLALVFVVLFPCVSFSDDLILLQSLASSVSPFDDSIAASRTLSRYAPDTVLDRLLRELDHVRLFAVYTLVLSFFLLAYLPPFTAPWFFLFSPLHRDRSPPLRF